MIIDFEEYRANMDPDDGITDILNYVNNHKEVKDLIHKIVCESPVSPIQEKKLYDLFELLIIVRNDAIAEEAERLKRMCELKLRGSDE